MDAEKAESLWQLSCDHGAASACTQLSAVAAGRNESKMALLYASKACVGGDPRGCTDLGVLALHGQGTRESRERAQQLFSYACSQGEAQACSLGSWLELDGGNPAEVRRALASECSGSSYLGCAGFGLLLENGMGGPRDVGGALAAFLKGCDAGEPAACVFGGVLIEEWSSVREHHRRALMLFETGCNAPISEPCWIDEGDEAEWREHLMGDGFSRRSCSGPRARALACYNAGLGYERGVGVAMDGNRAQERFDKSCREGLTRACRPARAFVVH